MSQLSHVNATIVPFLVEPGLDERREMPLPEELALAIRAPAAPSTMTERTVLPKVDGSTSIADLQWRARRGCRGG